ncbi:MAG TPA: molybdenum cofactor guanylyltransferase [Bacteroidales bacterium]|nr:molybdenum cofactor guanylyltransferase [Bacteroidales bacterium]
MISLDINTMAMLRDMSAVILAGGASKRFGGRPKSGIVIDGQTIISRLTGILKDIFRELIIVTNKPDEYSEIRSCIITPDIFRNAGPLGGIHAGMNISSFQASFVVASDMPFVEGSFIEKQADYFEKNSFDIVVPRSGRFIEPLHSIYSRSVLGSLEEFLLSGEKQAVWRFLEKVNTGYFEIAENQSNDIFMNINYPSDTDIAKKIMNERHKNLLP